MLKFWDVHFDKKLYKSYLDDIWHLTIFVNQNNEMLTHKEQKVKVTDKLYF